MPKIRKIAQARIDKIAQERVDRLEMALDEAVRVLALGTDCPVLKCPHSEVSIVGCRKCWHDVLVCVGEIKAKG